MLSGLIAVLYMAASGDVPQEKGAAISAECVVERKRAVDRRDTVTIYPPTPRNIPTLPLPAPERDRNAQMTYTVRVDPAGTPIQKTASVTGLKDSRYRETVLHTMQQIRYRPAMLDGCAVEGTYRFEMTLGNSK